MTTNYSASLIRNHFTCIFFEAADRLEVRSYSRYLSPTHTNWASLCALIQFSRLYFRNIYINCHSLW